jgi:2-C-methyl-D-erythritol 4-phosphate cytidylyltransferase
VVEAARTWGAATAAIPSADSIKRVADNVVVGTVERSHLVCVQTPQAFRTELLREAHRRALIDGYQSNDDCDLVERQGTAVRVVEGDPRNFKVTTPHDLLVLRRLAELHDPASAAVG